MSGWSVFKNKIGGFGVILMLAGAFPLGQVVYHQAFGVPAVAELTGVALICRVRTCEKCRESELACPEAEARRGEFQRIERAAYAELWFRDRAGRALTARAAFTMLGLDQSAQQGDRVDILYMSHDPAAVSRRGIPRHALMGLWAILLGGLIVSVTVLRARTRSGDTPAAPAPARTELAAGRRPQPTVARSKPLASRNLAEPVATPATARTGRSAVVGRRSVVQRNRGWFG